METSRRIVQIVITEQDVEQAIIDGGYEPFKARIDNVLDMLEDHLSVCDNELDLIVEYIAEEDKWEDISSF